METKGVMEQVTLEQNHEGGEGSNLEIIWGRASQEEEKKRVNSCLSKNKEGIASAEWWARKLQALILPRNIKNTTRDCLKQLDTSSGK